MILILYMNVLLRNGIQMNKVVVFTLAMVLVASMAVAGVSSNLVLLAKKSSSDSGSDSGSSSSGSGDGSGGSGDNSNGGNDNKGPSDAEPKSVPKTEEPKTDTPKVDKPKDEPPAACSGSCGSFNENPSVSSPIIPNPNPNPNPVTNPEPNPANPVVGGPDDSCLFHPDQLKCKSDGGNCPAGFFQNGKDSCVPNHEQCPKGFHSHEDDETGQCIPNSKPCEKGFIIVPNFPTCNSKPGVCRDFPHIRECQIHIPHSIHTIVKVIHKTKVVHRRDLIGIPTVFVPKVGLVEPFNCKLNENSGKIGCEFIIVKVIN